MAADACPAPGSMAQQPPGLVERVCLWFNYVGGIALFIMMLLTASDILGRALFNHPIKGALEMSEVMMVIVVFAGIGYCALQKEHVRVELLLMTLQRKKQLLLEVFASLLSFLLALAIGLEGLVQMATLKERFVTTPLLMWPTWPLALVLSIGALLMAIVLLRDLVGWVKACATETWHLSDWLLPALAVGAIAILVAWGFAATERLEPTTVGIVGMVLMLTLMFLGVPIGFCMALAGVAGMMYLVDMEAGRTLLQTTPFDTTSNYSLTVVPLFILMGAVAFRSGISTDLYTTAYCWLGHLPGGLAIATVGACAGFAAVSGSSLATAATMGMVALPEMRRYKYDMGMATGALAAGGTMGILIPPSVVMIIYGFLTTQPISTLFMAGFIPGILQAIFYMIVIVWMCKRRPEMGPPAPRSSFKQRLISLKGTWGVLMLFMLVLGGLYIGIFTPTEAGGVGAFGAFLFIVLRGRFNLPNVRASLNDSIKTTAMSFTVLIGAMFLGYFLTVTQIPFKLSDVVSNLPFNRYVILCIIIAVYLILGCVMDSLSIILITVPIFFPVITALKFDPIWFGILMVRMVEIGMITPPVGMNVFIIKGVAGEDVPMYTIFRGIAPFLAADIVHVVLLIAFPQITLFLPKLLGM